MNHPRAALGVILSITFLTASIVGPAGAGAGSSAAPNPSSGRLEMYEAVVSTALVQQITEAGYDLVDIEVLSGEEARITLVLRPGDAAALRKMGVELELWTNDDGLTSTQLAEQQSAFGFKVWRSFDEPGGFRDYMYDLAARNPDLLELEVLGETWGTNPEGAPGPSDDTPREIIALQLTAGADGFDPAPGYDVNQKPAVLYNSLQHAREWIGGEVNRRLLDWLIKRYRSRDPQIMNLLKTTELWFILVSNPDGYEYTFTHERLWRKNLRDNDPDGAGPATPNGLIDSSDGVDPNRNYPEHWGYDDDGSSPLPSSETYRGPSAASEPETQAVIHLYDNVDFNFHINWHSVGQWLLYGLGSIMDNPTADDPIFVALSGNDKRPAIGDFSPGLSSSELYITNGDTSDFAYAQRGALGWVPELSEGPNGDGFVYPDKEGAIQAEFVRVRPFALSVALSAKDPDDPVSSVGIETEPFYLDVSEIDPQKASNPFSDLTFGHSYGDPQPVQVLAKRDLNDDGVANDPVILRYSVNGGPTQVAPTAEWGGGDRYGGPGDEYYRFVRGNVTGIDAGDSVKVWFTGGGHTSDAFTFQVIQDTPGEVLVLSAEDYSGPTNVPAYPSSAGPFYLDYYTDALEANGISHDVYDVDAMGRTAPSHLGVLGHYDAVIWYTGNDFVTREPGQVPGTGFSTLAFREMLEVRAYLNEGGNLLFTGQHAGAQYAQAFPFNPVGTPPVCDGHVPNDTGVECRIADDDFLQYWLGSYVYEDNAGLSETGEPFDLEGVGVPLSGTAWTLGGGTGADNQASAEAFITTSSLLDTATYPQFTSAASAEWITGLAGAFEPHSGAQYLYSDQGDISYKRLRRDASVPAGGGAMTFFTSYDTEPLWDFVFVEVHDVTTGTWHTVPDQNGHTTTSTGDSCPEGWHELHPWLQQYQGADCSGAGWNGNSGRSHGWEEWEIDLTPFAGHDVEIYFSYASDWAIQGLGAWVDDVTFSWEGTTESFESDTGAWIVPAGVPAGSDPNPTDWHRSVSVGFEEGAVVGMEPSDADFRTLHFGFGFEAISTDAERNEVMCRSMNHLGVACP